eukprot:8084438-Heterocapsa_arctica.AAC.1
MALRTVEAGTGLEERVKATSSTRSAPRQSAASSLSALRQQGRRCGIIDAVGITPKGNRGK